MQGAIQPVTHRRQSVCHTRRGGGEARNCYLSALLGLWHVIFVRDWYSLFSGNLSNSLIDVIGSHWGLCKEESVLELISKNGTFNVLLFIVSAVIPDCQCIQECCVAAAYSFTQPHFAVITCSNYVGRNFVGWTCLAPLSSWK